MVFSIRPGAWKSVSVVPDTLVDPHIKMAGPNQPGIFLWALRHAEESFMHEIIATALDITAPDVQDAMQYWVQVDLVTEEVPEPTVQPATTERPLQPEFPLTVVLIAENLPPVPPRRIPKPDGLFIAERISQSAKIRFLIQEAQQLLERLPFPGFFFTLLAIHDDYGLPMDVTLMLLRFVKSKDKDSTSYVKTTARNWMEEDISTYLRVEGKLHRLNEINKAWRKIEQALRLSPRASSVRKERYSDRWLLERRSLPQMMRGTYGHSVDAIGRLSLNYMNKTLERWQREGITTPQQVAMEQKEKTTMQKQSKLQQTIYDIEGCERISTQAPDLLGKE